MSLPLKFNAAVIISENKNIIKKRLKMRTLYQILF